MTLYHSLNHHIHSWTENINLVCTVAISQDTTYTNKWSRNEVNNTMTETLPLLTLS